jgi:hypothetical protein
MICNAKRVRFLAVAALAIGGVSFSFAADQPNSGQSTTGDRSTATDNRSSNTNTNSTTSDRQDRATDTSSRASSNNADAPDAQAVSKIIGKTVDAALQGDVREISQNFYQADQKRFQETTKDQAQQQNNSLQQASADLKRTFQEKYHKELSLADASNVFGSDFARPNNAESSDRARPAGVRIQGSQDNNRTTPSASSTDRNASSADRTTTGGASGITGNTSNGSSGASANGTNPNSVTSGTASNNNGTSSASNNTNSGTSTSGNTSGTSGTSANSGAGTSGTSSNTGAGSSAASAMPQTKAVIIPESHGLPEVSLSMVKEGSDWKLNVPDTLTPQRLQDNLSRELTKANQMKDQWPADATQAERALAHHVLLAIMDQDSQRPGAAQGSDLNRTRTPGSDTDRSTNTDSNRSGTSGTDTASPRTGDRPLPGGSGR